ncbi:MAG: glutamate-5-semialdehyde dehydrogenase [Actinobacteria bacterium]|nr:glutamate-5-semialdehyde dehydrogenase [Actinomycetota bacterium]
MSTTQLHELAGRVQEASRELARTSCETRDAVLTTAAENLVARADQILEANSEDLRRAEAERIGETAVDRLRLTEARVTSMADGLRATAALSDPVGEVLDGWVRPNGLMVRRVRVPLGVVGVIYENRPNVTSDAAGLCLKSGNAVFLRGSSSAISSNRAIVDVLRDALEKSGLTKDAVALVEDTSHETAVEFMKLRGVIDCLIPRGGPALIASLLENATVPYVLDGDGNCHVYIDASADFEMAERIVHNAKTQRPGVCNAAESLLVHAEIAPRILPRLRDALAGVELVGDPAVVAILPGVELATDEEFATEFLGMKMSVAVVDSIQGAIEHIAKYGSGHSEAIVTSDLNAATQFSKEVDAAAVVVNASTRFVDGGELGLGAEVGISTQKLHARGPMGLRELTCVKWIVQGDGQVRE